MGLLSSIRVGRNIISTEKGQPITKKITANKSVSFTSSKMY